LTQQLGRLEQCFAERDAATFLSTVHTQSHREGMRGVSDGTSGTIPPHGPVIFRAPAGGWTWQAYDGAVRAFTRARGHAPRTVTMHPQTLERLTQSKPGPPGDLAPEAISATEAPPEALGREEHVAPAEHAGVRIVTSPDLERDTLVLA
jgi:hypothetical protein